MKVVEGKSSFSGSECVGQFFEEIRMLVLKGISLGLVLFLALTTLSFLNFSVDSFQDAVKKQVKVQNLGSPRQLMIPRRVAVRTPVYAAYSTGVSRQSYSPRETVRESSYFLNEVQYLMSTLGRFGK